jgi:hypothetical protein
LAKKNPEALEMDVVNAKDEEGNGYDPVYYGPSIGHFKDGDYCSKGDFESQELPEDTEINAVCIN